MKKQDTQYNEPELMHRLKQGDAAAFTQLYTCYSERLYYATLDMVKDSLLAEDLVQQVFTKIWQKRETIDITQHFSGYLFRVSQHMVCDFFRKLHRDKKLLRNFTECAAAAYTHIEEQLLRKENQALLEKVLDVLPQQRRNVFRLARIEGLTYKQIAASLDISVSTVRDHLVKSSKQLQQYLAEHPGLLLVLVLFLQ